MEGKDRVNDAHFHVGRFRRQYFSPKHILGFMDRGAIERVAVSSTTVCDLGYAQGLKELKWLVRHAPERIVPVLRVTPDMLETGWVDRYLVSGLKWGCVKIHRLLGWDDDDFIGQAGRFVELASGLGVPVLLHTGGGSGEADAAKFRPLLESFPECRMILAHSRPVDQTLEMLSEFPNAWCDTAFTPVENVATLVKAGFGDRVLWGTDYPIPQYFYPNKDMQSYYNNQLHKLKNEIPQQEFYKITYTNFFNIFCNVPI